jgi:hypothetical protein
VTITHGQLLFFEHFATGRQELERLAASNTLK